MHREGYLYNLIYPFTVIFRLIFGDKPDDSLSETHVKEREHACNGNTEDVNAVNLRCELSHHVGHGKNGKRYRKYISKGVVLRVFKSISHILACWRSFLNT